MIDDRSISSAVRALEALRNDNDLAYELRQTDTQEYPVASEIIEQEQAIQAMLPDGWSLEYDAPFYQINLFR